MCEDVLDVGLAKLVVEELGPRVTLITEGVKENHGRRPAV